MFGLFKKKDPEREWAIAEIKRLKDVINGADEGNRATFSMAFGIHWDLFVASQGGLATFANLPRNVQMDNFKKYLGFMLQVRESDPDGAIAMEFIAQLLSATITKDLSIQKDLIAFLQPYLGARLL